MLRCAAKHADRVARLEATLEKYALIAEKMEVLDGEMTDLEGVVDKYGDGARFKAQMEKDKDQYRLGATESTRSLRQRTFISKSAFACGAWTCSERVLVCCSRFREARGPRAG